MVMLSAIQSAIYLSKYTAWGQSMLSIFRDGGEIYQRGGLQEEQHENRNNRERARPEIEHSFSGWQRW